MSDRVAAKDDVENALPGIDFFRDQVQNLHELVEHTRELGTVVAVV